MQLASFLPHYQLVCISFDISSFSLISYTKRQVILLKTTGCFTQNDGSFYSKRRVVLLKTTGCFTQNDGLFYSKRRIVCCKIDEKHNPCNSRKKNCEKFYNASSHAYACAHITGVLHFLLSQVSQDSSHSSKFQPFTPIF